MTKRIKPIVLKREVIDALAAVERTAIVYQQDPDAMALLTDFRTNRAHGILSPAYVGSTPAFLIAAIERLDRAFSALHTFNPADYGSDEVFSKEMSRIRKESPRERGSVYDCEAIPA